MSIKEEEILLLSCFKIRYNINESSDYMAYIYIHIPFCKSICSYCDFCKVVYNKKWTLPYLDALKKEIEDKYENEEVKTLYIGGGTPSSLSEEELSKLYEIIKIFNITSDIEFTYECNINDITPRLLDILKAIGVNRLSLGIESFNQKKLTFMMRNHTYKDVKEKISLIRSKGFNNINIDLIYGIPKETITNLKSDLRKIIKLNPEHISTYSLIIENNTVISNINPIDEDTDYEMYHTICNYLKKKGYHQYEVSNFAKEGFSSIHNTNYWLNNNYYGFGLGSHGYIGNIRYENTKNLTKYINGIYVLNQNVLSKDEDMDNYLMLGLRLLKGINLQDFFDRYNINLQEKYNIKELLKEKKLLYKDGYLMINPKYIYTMNEILIDII